jgi:hypothetical protein
LCFYDWTDIREPFIRSTSSCRRAGLTLAVEVHGGDWRAEIVELGEVPGVEVLAPPGGVHRLPAELLEQHENEAVYAHGRPRVLIAHHLLAKCCPCSAWNVSDQPARRKSSRGSVHTSRLATTLSWNQSIFIYQCRYSLRLGSLGFGASGSTITSDERRSCWHDVHDAK